MVSAQKDVSSGMLQGSVLGPILFIIFINDIGNNKISKLSIFADDTKVGKVVNYETQAIDKLYKTLVRLHLEYCIQLWSPSLAGEKKMIECSKMCIKIN